MSQGMISEKMDMVKKILENSKIARDSDCLLLTKVWSHESNEYDSDEPRSHFFYDLVSGKYSTPETITRARRKLQEMYPELRGERYKKRHELAENVSLEMQEGAF